MRAQLTALITNSLKQPFRIQEPENETRAILRETYQPIFNFVSASYPEIGRAMNAEDNDDPVRWNAFWKGVRLEPGR